MRASTMLLPSVLCGALLFASCAPERPRQRWAGKPVPGEGIALLVEVGEDSLRILQIAPTPAPRAPLRSPQLVLKGWQSQRPGSVELVLMLRDRQGRSLGDYGFPLRRTGFFERVGANGKRPQLAGMPLTAASSLALVKIPYPRELASIGFLRCEVLAAPGDAGPQEDREIAMPRSGLPGFEIVDGRPGDMLAFRRQLIGLAAVRKPVENFDLRVPGLISKDDLRWIAAFLEMQEQLDRMHATERDTLAYAFLSTPMPSLLHGSGDPGGHFNVVFLGDGFLAEELSAYHRRVDDLRAGLLSTPPFSEFAGVTNVWRIDTASENSGVDHCPKHCALCACPEMDPDQRKTWFEVRGNAGGFGVCSDFALSDVDRVYQATASAIDPAEIDLFVMVVNCDVFGAKAHESLPLVFMAMCEESTDADFSAMAAHEVGHVLAPLGEEYISGLKPCGAPMIYGNIATLEEVDSGNVWWLELAHDDELVAGAGSFFRSVERQGDGACFDYYFDVLDATPLGAYWGAQYIADEPCSISPYCDYEPCGADPCQDQCCDLCCDWCDVRGADFFRPMPNCLMRSLEAPFCRVCAHELRSTLTSKISGA